MNVRIQKSALAADGDGRARTGAAGQGFSHAALEDPQPDMRPIDRFHEPDVDAPGKAWVSLDRGSQAAHRRRLDAVDDEHRMWVAHRDRSDLESTALDLQQVRGGLSLGEERQCARRPARAG